MNNFCIFKHLTIPEDRVFFNPSEEFYIDYLKPYYVITKDGQYLFASTQKGRMPDQVHYMVPKDYKLGVGQKGFDIEKGILTAQELSEQIEKKILKAGNK